MNQGGLGQQPQGAPQAQAQQLAAQQRAGVQIPLYKPEQMRSINLLTEDEKTKYERGLQQLWQLHDSKPAGSPENLDARKKLMDFGKMLQSKVAQRRQQMLSQQQRAQQQGQQVQQQQGQQLGQQQQGQQQQPPHASQNPNMQPHAGNQQTPQQQPSHLPGSAPGGNAQQQAPIQQQAPNANAPQAPRPGIQQPKIPDHIMQHVNQMNFQAPANEPDKAKWVGEMKLRYTRALLTMESSRANLARIEHIIKDRNEKGKPLTADEQTNFNAKKEQLQKSYNEGHAFVERTRQQLGFNKNAAQQQQQQNGGGQGSPPGPNQQQQPGTPRMQAPGQPGGGQAAGAGGNSMQSSAATVNAAIEAAKNQQLAAARLAAQGQQGLPQSAIVPPSAQPQGQPSPAPHQAQQGQAPPQQAQSQNQNQTQSQSQLHQQQQPQIKLEPGIHPNPNIPAPLNTALASAAAAGGLPSAGTPTQNSARSALQTPQTATPTTGQPRPLSHSAALSIANQRTGSIALPGQQPQGQNGTPTQSTPGTGSGVIGAAQQQPHPSQMPQHPGQHVQPGQQALQSKLPIPKVLPEKATQVPTPVANMGGIGSGRPTYSGGSGIGGGVMSQPALPKTPAYQLEGEGDRVLNKKKLDELVRQVCGGTAEGDEASLLTPDVEEVRFYFSRAAAGNLPIRLIRSPANSVTVRPQPSRQLRRQRAAQRMSQRKGAWQQGARDPRHPARARAHVQHTHPGLLERGAAHGAQDPAQRGVDHQDERCPSCQGDAWEGGHLSRLVQSQKGGGNGQDEGNNIIT